MEGKKAMKKSILVILFGLFLLASCVVYVPQGEDYVPPPVEERTYDSGPGSYPEQMDISYFYETLSPYGVWVYYSPYGYVWTPRHVSHRWRPYTYGRWVWTSFGWTWISYYDWGWIPFHYGRWGWAPQLGWYWVPGMVWAPAWVTWRWSDFYIGWAPLSPDIDFVAGVGVTFAHDLPSNYWIFIEGRYFQYDYLDRYVLPHERNITIIKYTVHKSNLVARNRQILNEGIAVDHVRRITRSEVSKYELEDARGPGQAKIEGGAVRLFRPTVMKNERAKPKSFLQKAEAEKRLPEIRTRDIEEKGVSIDSDRRLKEEQQKELRLLEQSQENDELELRRKVEDDKKLARTPSEKARIEKDFKARTQELKKKHQEEKSKISQRHQEEEKAAQKKVKKKEEKKEETKEKKKREISAIQ